MPTYACYRSSTTLTAFHYEGRTILPLPTPIETTVQLSYNLPPFFLSHSVFHPKTIFLQPNLKNNSDFSFNNSLYKAFKNVDK